MLSYYTAARGILYSWLLLGFRYRPLGRTSPTAQPGAAGQDAETGGEANAT